MFLSVVVPVYNAKRYIEECVQSLLMQTETDYEIILVDDGSTDGSGEICDAIAERNNGRIKVIHKKNEGALLARREGMSAAIGDFLYIIDADDYLISKDAFSIFKRTIEHSGCDMLFFKMTSSLKSRRPLCDYPFEHNQVFCGSDKKKLYSLIINGDTLCSLWNKVFARTIVDLEEDNSKFESAIICGEDLYQVLPIITRARMVTYLDDVLYYYRKTEASMTRIFDSRVYSSLKLLNQKIEEYSRKWEMEDVDALLDRRRLLSVAAAVNKVAYSDASKAKSEAIDYCKSISHDIYFKEAYKSNGIRIVALHKRILLYFLYREKYQLIIPALKLNLKLSNLLSKYHAI